MKKLSYLWLVLLIITVCLASCGSSADKPVTSLSVEMKEFTFTPASMTVAANQEISLHLSNTGAVDHDFTILKLGAVPKTPFDRDKQKGDILIDFKLSASQSGDFKFTLPAPGEYTFICAMPGHVEAGMLGKMRAVAP